MKKTGKPVDVFSGANGKPRSAGDVCYRCALPASEHRRDIFNGRDTFLCPDQERAAAMLKDSFVGTFITTNREAIAAQQDRLSIAGAVARDLVGNKGPTLDQTELLEGVYYSAKEGVFTKSAPPEDSKEEATTRQAFQQWISRRKEILEAIGKEPPGEVKAGAPLDGPAIAEQLDAIGLWGGIKRSKSPIFSSSVFQIVDEPKKTKKTEQPIVAIEHKRRYFEE